MLNYIYLLIILSSSVFTQSLFRRYQPIIFRTVTHVEDLNEVVSPGAGIYVKHDFSSSRFKISFFHRSLTVALVRPSFSDAPQIKVYGDKLVVYNTSDVKLNHFVGRVLDSPGSVVHGTIQNHVFTGTIQTKTKTYYVEPYSRHFNDTILYNAFIYEPENPYIRYCRDNECDLIFANASKHWSSTAQDPRKANSTHNLEANLKVAHQTEPVSALTVGKVCEVVAVADHTYYDFHLKTLANVIQETKEVIAAVNREFEGIDFNGDGKADRNSIVYAGTEVYQRPTGPQGSGLENKLTQEDLLIAFSRLMQKNPYCLAILFTARDFSANNTGPGLAFTAVSNPRGPDGGICSLRAKYGPPISGHARLNTLLVSFVHEGKTVPLSSMVVNLLHQIGHSFGSYHDPMSERPCTPNNVLGDYIMYPELHQEKLPNSRKFSSCSISRMLPVIRNKGWCLKDRSKFPGGQWRDGCGNGIVSDQEVCDCGLSSSCEDLDPCCRPPGDAHPCTLLPGVSCSPSVHVCCNQHCTFEDPGVACAARGDPECSSYGVCSGTDACVHMAAVVGHQQPCGDGRGICNDGKCVSNVCQQNGKEPCQCQLPANHRCHVCCIDENGECTSASVQGIAMDDGSPFLIPADRPCYEDMGACTQIGVCEVAMKETTSDRVLFGYRRLKMKTKSGWPAKLAYFLMLLVFIPALIILILGLIVNARRARLLTQFREACFESKRRIKNGGEDWDTILQRMRQDEWAKNRIVRLYALFPQASAQQIVEASYVEEEHDAIKHLLDQGLPMRKNFEVPWPPGTLLKKEP